LEKQAWFGLILLLLASCTQAATCETPFVSINGDCYTVEYAKTIEEQMQGLMFRESMPQNSGMLFFFNDMQTRRFWMRNTLIPLDMIFIDSNLVVVEVKHGIQPCKADPCPIYYSQPAQFVLEVNAGSTIKEGQVITLSE